jgi:hypothetical protein
MQLFKDGMRVVKDKMVVEGTSNADKGKCKDKRNRRKEMRLT